MTEAMQTGMKFGAFGEKGFSLSSSFAEKIIHDTTQAMAYDWKIDVKRSCTQEKGSETGVGLWQFVVQNGDGSVWT